tara:strand:+ start:1110 stop:1382 length:273 start_codon:yes stop_codon:yes gene_type:complete
MGKLRTGNPNILKTSASSVNHYSDSKEEDRSSTDELLNKSTSSNEERGSSGTEGTIRIVVDGELPYLEVKSGEGWVRSDNTSTSGFSFKK